MGDLSPRMELNLRRLAESDPAPLSIWCVPARQLQAAGLATILREYSDGMFIQAEAKITDAGIDWIDAN